MQFSLQFETGHGPPDCQMLIGLVHADCHTVTFKSGNDAKALDKPHGGGPRPAVSCKHFHGAFDWDLPTLEGFRAERARVIAKLLKLQRVRELVMERIESFAAPSL